MRNKQDNFGARLVKIGTVCLPIDVASFVVLLQVKAGFEVLYAAPLIELICVFIYSATLPLQSKRVAQVAAGGAAVVLVVNVLSWVVIFVGSGIARGNSGLFPDISFDLLPILLLDIWPSIVIAVILLFVSLSQSSSV